MNLFLLVPYRHTGMKRETSPWHSWLNLDFGVFVGVVGLRVGFCPDQVIDFLAGIFGFDPLGDDIDGERERDFREKYEKAQSPGKEANPSLAPAP